MILNERGIFWDARQEIPDGQWAPPGAVYGTIKIDAIGSIFLDLDGLLDGEKSLDILANRKAEAHRTIVGKIKNENQSILIPGALGNGVTYASNGICSEKYVGLFCLVGRMNPSVIIDHADNIDKMIIRVEKYSDAFDHKPIDYTKDGDIININCDLSSKTYFGLGDRDVNISYEMDVPVWKSLKVAKLNLLVRPKVEYTFTQEIGVPQVAKECRLLFDLLFLLSNIRLEPDWPGTYSSKLKSHADLYFMRHKYAENEFDSMKCWITINALGNEFKFILKNWIQKSDEFGPAFYLYLSTKTERDAYPEQSFMSLVTGLETLHRLTFKSTPNDKFSEKISRILSDVNKKDRRWLAQVLERSAEPTLDKRLYQLISRLDKNYNKKALNDFCYTCGKIRNNIAHFGSPNRGSNKIVTNQTLFDMSVILS